MAYIGQNDSSGDATSPGTDGSGSGVPQNNTINNFTNLANAIAADVAGVYKTVQSPPPAYSQTYQGPGRSTVDLPVFGTVGLVPLILIGVAAWLIFR